jgi:hypothetical protein
LCIPIKNPDAPELFFEQQQSVEIFHVLRPSCRLLHLDEIVQGGVVDFLISIRSGNSVLPNLIESDSLNERMDIRLYEVLPDKNLLRKEVLLIQIRHIIPEFFEGS